MTARVSVVVAGVPVGETEPVEVMAFEIRDNISEERAKTQITRQVQQHFSAWSEFIGTQLGATAYDPSGAELWNIRIQEAA